MQEAEEIEITEAIQDLAARGLVQIESGASWLDATVTLTPAGWAVLEEVRT